MRESLRVLTPARLRAVAGGGRKNPNDSADCLLVIDEKDLGNSVIDTQPRSNAWTGDVEATC